jgi:prepilin-type N-terminal cleavage/methylation domain-containing protein
MRVRRKGKRGATAAFTLLEVMAALAIGLIMISVLFVGIQQGTFVLSNSREDLRATQVLLQKAEAIRLLTWPELSNCPTSFQTAYYPNGATNTPGIVYYGSLSALDTPTNIPSSVSYQTNVHLITVTITWTNSISGTSVPHTRTLMTYSALNGMQNYLYGTSP